MRASCRSQLSLGDTKGGTSTVCDQSPAAVCLCALHLLPLPGPCVAPAAVADLGALEQDVLQEVGCAIVCVRLKPAARVDPDADRGCLRVGVGLGSNPQAIRQRSDLQRNATRTQLSEEMPLTTMRLPARLLRPRRTLISLQQWMASVCCSAPTLHPLQSRCCPAPRPESLLELPGAPSSSLQEPC